MTDAPAWLTAMDRNGDGELSRHEFLGTARQFSAIDRNADGVIDPQEARDTESAGTAGREWLAWPCRAVSPAIAVGHAATTGSIGAG